MNNDSTVKELKEFFNKKDLFNDVNKEYDLFEKELLKHFFIITDFLNKKIDMDELEKKFRSSKPQFNLF